MHILANATSFYEIESNWSLTELLTGVTTGDVWDIADFGGYLLAANGNVMVKRDPATGTWSSFASATDIPRVLTICNFKGQAIGGNVKTDWYDCDTGSVVWSEIGSAKFTPTKLNTAGYRPILPFGGTILRVKRLGDLIMVYGSDGVAAMVPVGDPAPTFGFKEILNIGIPCKGAIGGDEHVHAFVDTDGWLWKVKEGSMPERSGYQEFFSPMLDNDIMVSLDPSEQEFYISDGTANYLLTPYGLCKTYQYVTSVFLDGDDTIGPFTSSGVTSFRVVTDTLDFGLRGFKSLGVVELGVDTGEVDQDVDVALYHRSNKKNAFSQTSYIHTNPEGWTYPNITAHEFRLCVQADDYAGIKLDYINARVKVVDRRGIRGIYAMQKYAEGQKR